MKQQRASNPRFLGALGFLGFLGFLGAQNPEVMRWAKLSWLSLISLLVLFPVMYVEGSRVKYQLNPGRKWMLAFLLFLGALGFLFSDIPGRDWLSFLSFLSFNAMNAFGGEKKERVPLKELVPIFLLLLIAIMLPVGGMIWFMTAAVRNEQMAVRQRLTKVYESQLNAAFRGLEESIAHQRAVLAEHAERSPALRFEALVRESFADSIVVLDEKGKVAYPVNSGMNVDPPSAEALLLQTEIRSLLQGGTVSNALGKIEAMATDEILCHVRDESGRMILPPLQLFYLQLVSDGDEVRESIRTTITDYTLQMSSARRLFYLQALSRLGMDVEPWLSAEALAAELEDLLPDTTSTTYVPVPGKELYLLFSEDHRTVAVFNDHKLLADLQEQINAVPSVEGIRMVLEQGQSQAWLAKPLLAFGGGDWTLGLYMDDDDPFAATADRRIIRYIWVGNMLVVLMVFIFVLLIRSLLAQQRLTHMKNDFVATVTHELKTPLASTRMLVDTLLEGRCTSDTQQREYLELIARENKRLSRLIDNFLTFSRMERNKRTFDFEDVAPGDIAEAAVETVHENYEQCGCKLSVEVAETLPIIVADRDAMVQVLLNLLDNACKYSDGDKRIQLRVFERERTVCFQVKDNGIGMEKRERSKIMDRFYQVDQSMTRKAGGAGLGLSIVSFIVEAHGGHIGIESDLGKGSTFTVEIPFNGED